MMQIQVRIYYLYSLHMLTHQILYFTNFPRIFLCLILVCAPFCLLYPLLLSFCAAVQEFFPIQFFLLLGSILS